MLLRPHSYLLRLNDEWKITRIEMKKKRKKDLQFHALENFIYFIIFLNFWLTYMPVKSGNYLLFFFFFWLFLRFYFFPIHFFFVSFIVIVFEMKPNEICNKKFRRNNREKINISPSPLAFPTKKKGKLFTINKIRNTVKLKYTKTK